MGKEIIARISIEGKELPNFVAVSIQQCFNGHHSFELIVNQDMLATGAHTLQSTTDYIGKFIFVGFGEESDGDNFFKGIITEVSLRQGNGQWSQLIMKGYSPTYLLEGGEHYASFLERPLRAVVQELAANLASNDLNLIIKPESGGEVTYATQYKESHFQFLNRLAIEHGEWFFYDGLNLFFGRPSDIETVNLVYGRHIEQMDFSLHMVPNRVTHYSYGSHDDTLYKSESPQKIEGADVFTSKVMEVTDKLYRKTVWQPTPVRTSQQGSLDAYGKQYKETTAARYVKVSVKGDNPKVRIGNYASVALDYMNLEGQSSSEQGSFLVTRITHRIVGTGAYEHEWEGISSSSNRIPATTQKPQAETQMAVVMDNNDPKGQGRIKVQMLWQKANGQTTDWIRVLTPDGGSSKDVGKNRGFVFIPEVGDQVLLGFRYNDPDRPFVLGSMFHGKAGGGGSEGNQSKSITTRTGSTLLLNDAAHTVTMQTSNGNTIKVDEKSGAVSITSGSSVSISSKSISISGSESISIVAPSITIGTLGGEKPTDTVTIEGKAVKAEGENTADMTSKVVTVNGTDQLNEYGGKYTMQVAEASFDGGSKIAMVSDQTDIA